MVMLKSITPGRYIVAVSGGVDSVVLLHALSQQPDLELVVAHLDHGMREDSYLDAEHVQNVATEYGLPYEVGVEELSPSASEAQARAVRYNFLRLAQHKHGAQAIITAHHHDDVLETAIINISRGTGRLGLSSLQSNSSTIRPFLHMSKQELINYAQANNLEWREDPTNQSTDYLRNHIRHNVLPKFNDDQRQELAKHIADAHEANNKIQQALGDYLAHKSFRRAGKVYSRIWFNGLPHSFACEIVHHWLAEAGVKDYSRTKIDKLATQLKTAKPGKGIDVSKKFKLELTKRSIRLVAN